MIAFTGNDMGGNFDQSKFTMSFVLFMSSAIAERHNYRDYLGRVSMWCMYVGGVFVCGKNVNPRHNYT